MTAATTSWQADETCEGFEAYRDLPEQLLGYENVFRALGLDRGGARVVLDYGCGPGKVARRAAHRFGVRVHALDSSIRMLELATRMRPHPLVEYSLVEDDRAPFLPDGAVDGAMACYVFINTAQEARIQRVAEEVFRIVKPGGRFVVLDTNPATTGVEFSTFRCGEPGRTYAYGDRREVRLRQDGGRDLVLIDYHWPKDVYERVLGRAGFELVEVLEPTLEDVPAEALASFEAEHGPVAWRGERHSPPFVIFVGAKP